MMRRLLPLFVSALVLLAFALTLVFLYQKSRDQAVVYETTTAKVANIIEKTVAAGAIVPRQEVAIKPRVSGVLQKLHVQPGQKVEAGDLIAEIKIIPDMVNLNSAEARVNAAEISLDSIEREYQRLKKLFDLQLVSQTEFSQVSLQYELAQQEVHAARDNLQLVKEGAIRGSGKVSNQVRSTVSGTVIEVPVEEGFSVIETNTFSEGTTIASVADMSDMIFKGRVDESEVGKIEEKMPVSISVGAIENRAFQGVLEYISPKGIENEGTIEFEIRAAVKLAKDAFIRANYSANADIILDRREQVLALDERLIEFEKGKAYVEVEISPQKFKRRGIELGLSDGIKVEVLKGLNKAEAVKVPRLTGNGENSGH